MVKKMKAGKLNSNLIDTMIEFSKLKDPNIGWHKIGSPPSEDRIWRYTAIEPVGKDIMHRSQARRHRQITLPEELKNWFKPDFDDSKWNKGKAPIGIGVFKQGRTILENKSQWGDGEFILMRTTFEMDSIDYDKYRVRSLACKGFTVYLNGRSIYGYGWWENKPYYRQHEIRKNNNKAFRKGTNVLAIYAGAGYDQENFEPIGQIDLYIEGLNTSEFK